MKYFKIKFQVEVVDKELDETYTAEYNYCLSDPNIIPNIMRKTIRNDPHRLPGHEDLHGKDGLQQFGHHLFQAENGSLAIQLTDAVVDSTLEDLVKYHKVFCPLDNEFIVRVILVV